MINEFNEIRRYNHFLIVFIFLSGYTLFIIDILKKTFLKELENYILSLLVVPLIIMLMIVCILHFIRNEIFIKNNFINLAPNEKKIFRMESIYKKFFNSYILAVVILFSLFLIDMHIVDIWNFISEGRNSLISIMKEKK